MRGALISIEGLDGAGKTSAIASLREHLSERDPICLREPGGTALGELLRAILKRAPLPAEPLGAGCQRAEAQLSDLEARTGNASLRAWLRRRSQLLAAAAAPVTSSSSAAGWGGGRPRRASGIEGPFPEITEPFPEFQEPFPEITEPLPEFREPLPEFQEPLPEVEGPLSAQDELLLFNAARAELCELVIRPALAAGRVVICDRFIDSTIAYQGYGRGLDPELVRSSCLEATADLEPDLTLLLRIDPGVRLKRIRGRGEQDRIERSGEEFFARVAAGFDHLAAVERRIVPIDAEQPLDLVTRQLLDVLEAEMGQILSPPDARIGA